MPAIDIVVRSETSSSVRARQLEAIFDVPRSTESVVQWRGELPIEGDDWNVGLIVGPSGSGKSTVARSVFGDAVDVPLAWGGKSVIDDFSADLSMEEITGACQAVGFNTIPAWLRPYAVLSTGEKFRVELARRVLELPDPIVVDEFTSVVDRQVAQIGAHALQKFVRRNKRKFVAVTCHYDVIDWLQPDWVLEPATMTFTRRSLQRRPAVECVVSPVPHAAWSLFAPYHYLTAELSKSARCFVLFANGQPAAFAGMLYRPRTVKHGPEVMGCSRLVTLPDWQGLGLAFALIDTVASIYGGIGRVTHTYPAHPALIRAFDRSKRWRLNKKPLHRMQTNVGSVGGMGQRGGRPNAVFRYAGPALERSEAERVLSYWKRGGDE